VISVENRKILPSQCIWRPGNEIPLGIWYRRSVFTKLEWLGYPVEKEVWRYLQPCGYNTPSRVTQWLTIAKLWCINFFLRFSGTPCISCRYTEWYRRKSTVANSITWTVFSKQDDRYVNVWCCGQNKRYVPSFCLFSAKIPVPTGWDRKVSCQWRVFSQATTSVWLPTNYKQMTPTQRSPCRHTYFSWVRRNRGRPFPKFCQLPVCYRPYCNLRRVFNIGIMFVHVHDWLLIASGVHVAMTTVSLWRCPTLPASESDMSKLTETESNPCSLL